MRPLRHSPSIDQAAAFALFEAFRQAQGLAAAPEGTWRATCLRPVDPAVAGLGFSTTDDDALQLRFGEVPRGVSEHVWIHASCDERGPALAVYLNRERPSLHVRFGGAAFVAGLDGRYVLRERPTHPSHDGRHREREALTRRLAEAWRVPLDGPWLTMGAWDASEARWEPDAPRRVLAIALILEAARQLDESWLTR